MVLEKHMGRFLSQEKLIAIWTQSFKLSADPNSTAWICNESIVSYKRAEIT